MSSSESSSRRSRTNDSAGDSSSGLSAQRRSARTMGCVGLSIVAHAAFLAALAISQEHAPELMGQSGVELVSGAAVGSEASTVSLVDTEASATAAVKPEATGVLTEATSDIALPEPQKALPEKTQPVLPEKKAIVKAPAPVKPAKVAAAKPTVTPEAAAPVVTSEDEVAPVLLANPPGDTPSSDQPETAVSEVQETAAVQEPVAEVVEELPAKVEAAKPVETVSEAAPVAVAEAVKEEAVAQKAAAPQQVAPVAAAAVAETPQEEATASSGSGNGSGGPQGSASGQGSAVTGPIRNSNDLKALRGNPNPVYPARDRLARRQGTTVVLGRIAADGRVTDIKLEKSSGSPSMDAASLQAFRSWRYQAGQEGWVRKPFEFRLVGDAMEVPSPLGKGLKR